MAKRTIWGCSTDFTDKDMADASERIVDAIMNEINTNQLNYNGTFEFISLLEKKLKEIKVSTIEYYAIS